LTTIRLRTGYPRRRGRGLPVLALVLVLALAAAAVFGMRGLTSLPDDQPVQIQALDAAAAAALLPPPVRPFLDRHRVVAYYGNPLSARMGIVGEYEPAELIRRLRAQAAAYQPLSPDRTIVPAIHLIYAVAHEHPGPRGLYLGRMEDELIESWIQLTRDEGILLFLDIQFGRSTIQRELPFVLPFLKHEHVHLALDPEFAWGPDQYPLIDIGGIDAETVNYAQTQLENLVVEYRLGNKILVVHQFVPGMIRNRAAIRSSERVEVVIDADGFGSPRLKIDQWNQLIRDPGVERAGFKLFYKQDAASGGLMNEADVMSLVPAPLVIIYQ
jgi:hypothetical protein